MQSKLYKIPIIAVDFIAPLIKHFPSQVGIMMYMLARKLSGELSHALVLGNGVKRPLPL